MPELPEVETTRRGVAPLLDGRSLQAVLLRDPLALAGGTAERRWQDSHFAA